MKPINIAERNRMIRVCSLCYLMGLALFFHWFSLAFVFIPISHQKHLYQASEVIKEVYRYANDADSLVTIIQKAPTVEAENLLPFYKWTYDLEAGYPQPFYQLIFKSYTNLVTDITTSKNLDSSYSTLKQKLISARKEGISLRKENETLKEALNDAKAKK